MNVKVLVVDDDNCSSGIFKAYLDFKEDWKITTAESPKKAFEIMQESKFDVVVALTTAWPPFGVAVGPCHALWCADESWTSVPMRASSSACPCQDAWTP